MKRQVSSIKYQVSGFTLIELLIVVAIISILVSIGAVSFQRVQQQGRDTTRKADLQEVASALEQFYSDNNTYPKGDASFQVLDCDDLNPTAWGEDPPESFECSSPDIIYLSEMPGDPQGTNEYRYQSTTTTNVVCDNGDPLTTCQRFTLSAKLERDATPCDGTYNFCVNNP